MITLQVNSDKKKEVIDLTAKLRSALDRNQAADGLYHLFLTHTSAAPTTADLDPGTDLDLLDAFKALVPRLDYRHPHSPKHVADHIRSSLIGTSLWIPVKNREPRLGTWQRVVLVEFDGPRERQITLSMIAERPA
jgi:secondary thiamine-phosphate synthase enzyme